MFWYIKSQLNLIRDSNVKKACKFSFHSLFMKVTHRDQRHFWLQLKNHFTILTKVSKGRLWNHMSRRNLFCGPMNPLKKEIRLSAWQVLWNQGLYLLPVLLPSRLGTLCYILIELTKFADVTSSSLCFKWILAWQ